MSTEQFFDMPDFVLICLVAGSFIFGTFFERYSIKKITRRPYWKKRQNHRSNITAFTMKTNISKASAPDQLQRVMGANFDKRRLLNRAEANVMATAQRAIQLADLKWKVMAQVNLGEILTSPDKEAFSAINSKRVDLLMIDQSFLPIAVIEYQGSGHYQKDAAARDAVKKEALRKAGIRYIEISNDHNEQDLRAEIQRLARNIEST